MNVVHKFPDILDDDMNRELYLLAEEEITEAQYNTIKNNYGVTGPDFQIVKRGTAYFLKGDMDIEVVKECVNIALASKGVEAVFTADDSGSDEGTDEGTDEETGTEGE